MGNAVSEALPQGRPCSKQDLYSPKFEQRYRLGAVLGRGTSATVYKCYDKEAGVERAVKVVDREELDPKEERAIREEVSILLDLAHPYIVKCFDFFESRNDFKIVQELCQGGELFDKIIEKRHYSEAEARDISRMLLEAVAYSHSKKVLHRDLKPENILLVDKQDDTHIKVVDFGLSRRIHDLDVIVTRCGSPGYCAPEIIKGDKYDEKVDCWSLGVIIYVLLGGFNPFWDDNIPLMLAKIRKGTYTFYKPYFNAVSDEAKDLIRHLIVTDPTKRITAQAALQHAWFKKCGLELSKRDLSSTPEVLRKHLAKSRFKAAAQAVMASNRLRILNKNVKDTLTEQRSSSEMMFAPADDEKDSGYLRSMTH